MEKFCEKLATCTRNYRVFTDLEIWQFSCRQQQRVDNDDTLDIYIQSLPLAHAWLCKQDAQDAIGVRRKARHVVHACACAFITS